MWGKTIEVLLTLCMWTCRPTWYPKDSPLLPSLLPLPDSSCQARDKALQNVRWIKIPAVPFWKQDLRWINTALFWPFNLFQSFFLVLRKTLLWSDGLFYFGSKVELRLDLDLSLTAEPMVHILTLWILGDPKRAQTETGWHATDSRHSNISLSLAA